MSSRCVVWWRPINKTKNHKRNETKREKKQKRNKRRHTRRQWNMKWWNWKLYTQHTTEFFFCFFRFGFWARRRCDCWNYLPVEFNDVRSILIEFEPIKWLKMPINTLFAIKIVGERESVCLFSSTLLYTEALAYAHTFLQLGTCSTYIRMNHFGVYNSFPTL